MPKARILKGGWSWKGDTMVVGEIINAPSVEWIANRVADGGLVEAVAEPAAEAAAIAPTETATLNAPPKRRKAQ